MALLMGIDVGGTNLRIGVFDDLALIDEMRFQADFSGICQNLSLIHIWWWQCRQRGNNASRNGLVRAVFGSLR